MLSASYAGMKLVSTHNENNVRRLNESRKNANSIDKINSTVKLLCVGVLKLLQESGDAEKMRWRLNRLARFSFVLVNEVSGKSCMAQIAVSVRSII